MITYKRLKQESMGSCCRKCLNMKYQLQLEREDCLYCYYPYECEECKEVKNIVQDIRYISRWKLLGGRKMNDESKKL